MTDTNKRPMLVSLFPSRASADAAVHELTTKGIAARDLSVMMREEHVERTDNASSVAQGAGSGAATGGVVGALTGLLVGLGAIAIPGIGPLLVAGPIAAALGLGAAAGATATGAVTGALAGGLIGALVGLGVPEGDAKYYETKINEGAVLVGVPTDQSNLNEEQVRNILLAHGAENIQVARV